MGEMNVRRLIVLGALAVAAVLPRAAGAQELTAYATASLDGYDTNIALIGASARPAGLGLKPVVAMQVYWLNYEVNDETVSVLSFGPSVGASYRMPGGAVEGRVGYNFQDEDVESPILEGEGGGGSGVTTTVQALSWASRPELQGIASYNWGGNYLWSQAQALMPILDTSPGGIAVGAEVVWQGNVGGDENQDYQSWQAGPALRWSTGNNSSVTVGAGYKDSNTRDATWYARIGVVKYGIELGIL